MTALDEAKRKELMIKPGLYEQIVSQHLSEELAPVAELCFAIPKRIKLQ